MEINKYKLTNKDGEYMYKETTFDIRTNILKNISIGGDDIYCMVVKINSNTPNVAYIDRVEYNNLCSLNRILKRKVGIQNLVSSCLWTIKKRYPDIKIFTLKDDSHIECEENSKMYKLSLAYDYILKYNQTWYQKLFQATLPEPILRTFTDSLEVLDKPLYSIEFMIESGLDYLKKYKDIYTSSNTPRDFINKLREQYGLLYCKEVCKWLVKYMEYLDIKLYYDLWYISADILIEQPEDYSLEPYVQRGGRRRQTRKKYRKQQNTTMMYDLAPTVGTYSDFM